jgi:hypothetical protein|tara:strand:- start:49 stop:459 length:411 start_codon:yes stop_codon:yes gene_type:complete
MILCLSISCKSKNQISHKTPRTVTVSLPTFPNCKNKNDRLKCSENYIGDLIISEVMEQKMFVVNDTIDISLSVETDGTVKPISNEIKSSNEKLKDICNKVLNKIPKVKPAFNFNNNEHQNFTHSFYLIIIDNNLIE